MRERRERERRGGKSRGKRGGESQNTLFSAAAAAEEEEEERENEKRNALSLVNSLFPERHRRTRSQLTRPSRLRHPRRKAKKLAMLGASAVRGSGVGVTTTAIPPAPSSSRVARRAAPAHAAAPRLRVAPDGRRAARTLGSVSSRFFKPGFWRKRERKSVKKNRATARGQASHEAGKEAANMSSVFAPWSCSLFARNRPPIGRACRGALEIAGRSTVRLKVERCELEKEREHRGGGRSSFFFFSVPNDTLVAAADEFLRAALWSRTSLLHLICPSRGLLR